MAAGYRHLLIALYAVVAIFTAQSSPLYYRRPGDAPDCYHLAVSRVGPAAVNPPLRNFHRQVTPSTILSPTPRRVEPTMEPAPLYLNRQVPPSAQGRLTAAVQT